MYKTQHEKLRVILENLRFPDRLDNHPWVKSLFVQDFVSAHPELQNKNPGYQLVEAVTNLFIKMMPGSPPKLGKRLDTSWGKFGLLAAMYFAPYKFGIPYPDNLRDGWNGIDQAILLMFRFSRKIDLLSNADETRFKLIGDELAVSPLSTISDWHVQGVKKLAELIDEREQKLKSSLQHEFSPDQSLPTKMDSKNAFLPEGPPKESSKHVWFWIKWLVLATLFITIIIAGIWTWQVYEKALVIRSDLVQIQALASSPITLEKIRNAEPNVGKIRQEVGALNTQASPVLRVVGPLLAWFPVYGPDLSASADLLDFADKLTAGLQNGLEAGRPFLEPDVVKYNPKQVIKLFIDAQPNLKRAKEQIDSALEVRERFRNLKFSHRTQEIIDRIDPMLGLLDDGLNVATSLPKVFGADNSGPKSYMVLIQNEDELRPTGGLITSVGTFVVKDGNIFALNFEESGTLEDWTLPYPDAPWQLVQYMNSPVMVLRDANWYPDYPTAVNWIEYLYAYNHKNTVDGVFAIDQQALVSLLKVIGPVNLEGESTIVSSDNVIDYMRSSKTPPAQAQADFYRKAFIGKIANAILQKMIVGGGIDWRSVAQMMWQNLNERNILLQFDDPQMTALLSKYGWDGAVRRGSSDFLMIIDTNVGFNKTNAVVDRKISYDIDLTDLSKPTSNLVIFHNNHANTTNSCIHWEIFRAEKIYPIHYCYWNYLRVYVSDGTMLDSATPHVVPADWMLLGEPVQARVDTLEKDIPGLNGFGTMMVIPGGQTLDTSFKFSLPADVIVNEPGLNRKIYILKIQKQPGIIAAPITVRIHLPPDAAVEKLNPNGTIDGQNVLIETDLRTDLIVSVVFSTP